MKKRQPTRERILEAALELFNQKGAASVTTHHIAAACGISPGNLYYHFSNKEEIILGLFEQAIAMHESNEERTRTDGGEGGIDGGLRFLKNFNWRYRFFKRELPMLMKNDRRFRLAFQEFQAKHLASLEAAVRIASEAGSLRPFTPGQRKMLVDLCWLVSLFWPSFVEVRDGRVTRSAVDRGSEILYWLFQGLAAK